MCNYLIIIQQNSTELLILHKNIRNLLTIRKLFVFSSNTWKQIIVNKLFVLDRNTWNHIIMYILIVLDKNKSWQQHPIRHQLYGHLPPITKTIQVRRTRHAGHCWISKDELISDVLQWTPAYDRAKAGRPARTYIQQLCEDTGCSHEDQPEAMNDREKWWERVRDIRVSLFSFSYFLT